MTKNLKLRCTLEKSKIEGMCDVSGQLFDGTSFKLTTQDHYVLPNEKLEEGKTTDGFVRVHEVGRQHDRATVVLPGPSLIFGRNITVKTHDLYPENVSVKDFISK